jgi:hypothetical protein
MCRFLALTMLSAMALALVMVLPATAQDQPKDDHPAAQHARLTWEEHFTQANKAQDGHLTLDEAKSGYPTISRHFHAIDIDGKGFVTENDIRAWKALQKATRAQPHEAADALRPRNAFQLQLSAQRPLNTDTKQTVAVPSDRGQNLQPLHDSN